MAVHIKSPEEIETMRVAGRLASEVLDYITPFVEAGVTTERLDTLCHNYMVDVQGTIPAPLNYAPRGHRPFPKSICTSINHQICHGIPSDRVLKNGDSVNIDVTVIYQGYHGDTSRMFLVGDDCSIGARRLSQVCYECMWYGLYEVKAGAHIGNIGAAIEKHADKFGFGVVTDFCGHGLGRNFHEAPQIAHYGQYGTGIVMVPGMTFTIEPMINAGKKDVRILADGWTAVTKDRSLSAQWEHSILVTESGFEILTVSAQTPPPPPL